MMKFGHSREQDFQVILLMMDLLRLCKTQAGINSTDHLLRISTTDIVGKQPVTSQILRVQILPIKTNRDRIHHQLQQLLCILRFLFALLQCFYNSLVLGNVTQHEAAGGRAAFIKCGCGLQPYPEHCSILFKHPERTHLGFSGLKKTFSMQIIGILVFLVDESSEWLFDECRPGHIQQSSGGEIDLQDQP